MSTAPGEMDKLCPLGSDRRMPPRRISPNPKRIRLSTFSRKTTHAMAAVATVSRFNSREAALAGVVIRPSKSKTGPSTPPAKKPPASQGRSFRETGVSFSPTPEADRTPRMAASPTPDPRYNRPATSTGSADEIASFAKGVLAPKSNAAAIALAMPAFGLAFMARAKTFTLQWAPITGVKTSEQPHAVTMRSESRAVSWWSLIIESGQIRCWPSSPSSTPPAP